MQEQIIKLAQKSSTLSQLGKHLILINFYCESWHGNQNVANVCLQRHLVQLVALTFVSFVCIHYFAIHCLTVFYLYLTDAILWLSWSCSGLFRDQQQSVVYLEEKRPGFRAAKTCISWSWRPWPSTSTRRAIVRTAMPNSDWFWSSLASTDWLAFTRGSASFRRHWCRLYFRGIRRRKRSFKLCVCVTCLLSKLMKYIRSTSISFLATSFVCP